MHIGVISDSHGMKHSIKKAVQIVNGICNVERWIHAGDYARDGEYLNEITDKPVSFVCGNCDGMFSEAPVDQYLQVYGKMIWVTHGHLQGVKFSLKQLMFDGKDINADVIVYGHTHIPDITWEANTLLFNPGSAYNNGFNAATCGIITIEENGAISARIIKLS